MVRCKAQSLKKIFVSGIMIIAFFFQNIVSKKTEKDIKILMSNVPGVRRRPQKYQETWGAIPGVRTSRLLGS
jgi:hypothetical protein